MSDPPKWLMFFFFFFFLGGGGGGVPLRSPEKRIPLLNIVDQFTFL